MEVKKLSVLIVDDNRYFLKRMTDLLYELDTISSICTAQNCEEASSILDKTAHDLVLLDIQLPDNNGINLLKNIKKTSPSPEVIMISNCSGEYYRKQCEKLGARHFLDKTQDFEMVPELLSDIV